MWLLVGLVLIYLILSPLIALIKSSSAHDQIELLHKKIKKLGDELTQLKKQLEKDAQLLDSKKAPEDHIAGNQTSDPASALSRSATISDKNPAIFPSDPNNSPAPAARPALKPAPDSEPSLELHVTSHPIHLPSAKSRHVDICFKPIDETPESRLGVIKEWFAGGNLVAKLGLFILLIGVGFLTKYATARMSISIETRLGFIVVGAIILLAWSFRIAKRRPQIAMSAQGCSIAILMLVIFSAYRLYQLIPADLAFILLFLLTVFTSLLAHFQSALWLAIFGIVGGFLVPVLVTKGQGSHIVLFSYYALLSSGVLALAWKHSWRLLNLLSFCLTAGAGVLWGFTSYSSNLYLSTQMFLIFFTLLFIGISVMYAFRESKNSSRYVDGSLVFGVPTMAFSLQYGLMKNTEFGLAISALISGIIYLAIALFSWSKQGARLRFLNESFLAIGIVFITIAVPLAVDSRWTSAAWALEGAALVWVGLRQQQKITWVFGILIQLAACLAFIGSNIDLEYAAVRNANLWLGFLVLAMSSYLVAISLRNERQEPSNVLDTFSLLFLYAAAAWLLFGMWVEVFLRTSGALSLSLISAAGLTAAAFSIWVAKRHEWLDARILSYLILALAGSLFSLLSIQSYGSTVPSLQSANLFETPFIGGIQLVVAALYTAWNLKNNKENHTAIIEILFLLAALLIWAFFVLTPLADVAAFQFSAQEYMPGLAVANNWMALLFALSTLLLLVINHYKNWPKLLWLGQSVWIALAWFTAQLLWDLILMAQMPVLETWIAYFILWFSGEKFLQTLTQVTNSQAYSLSLSKLQWVHVVRILGLWTLLVFGFNQLVLNWLTGHSSAELQLLAEGSWYVEKSWAHYLAAWFYTLLFFYLMRRAHKAAWPVTPLQDWYIQSVLPVSALLILFFVVYWNFTHDGSMPPLHYVPILNPLDITTLLVFLMFFKLQESGSLCLSENSSRYLTGFAIFVWANFIFLRSAVQWLPLSYDFVVMMNSQTIQTMLSLFWTACALFVMYWAYRNMYRSVWLIGAALLAIVLVKLFLVDLSDVGGLARVISFIGVGLLMVLIGYLAPLPEQNTKE